LKIYGLNSPIVQDVFAQTEETKFIHCLISNIEKKWHMKTLKTEVVKMVIFF